MPNYLGGLYDYSTKELVEELSKREGVERLTVAPHSEYAINIDEDWEGKKEAYNGEGGAVLLVVID